MLSLEIRLMVVASVLAIVLGLAGVAVLGSGVARAQEPQPQPQPEDGVLEVDPDGPAPQPVLFGDVSTTDDFFAALDAAGFGIEADAGGRSFESGLQLGGQAFVALALSLRHDLADLALGWGQVDVTS